MTAHRLAARAPVRLICALLAGVLSNSTAARAEPDSYAAVVKGRALTTAGDCIACHTAPGGVPFAGGLGLQTPFGTIMVPNITPDDGTGLGRWSADDFARALHEGIRPDGGHLYPAFPYAYYTKLTRDDADAIYAYLRSLPPTEHPVGRNTLPFPFNIRYSMTAWNAMFFTPGTFVPNPGRTEQYNRGAYLVEDAGHCGACHTPLNALGANKASQFLQSNQIDNWTAPNITNDARQGLGRWSVDDIVAYLHTGHNETSIATGPMAEVVAYSTSQMPDADLRAMAVYLKERGATGSAAPAALAQADPRMRTGEAIYIDTCSACHNQTGAGVVNIFPRLANNPVVHQDDATSLVRVVLTGARGAVTQAAPTGPAMPSLGFRLNDNQVAAVVTYIRNSWGNAAPAVAESDVRALRAKVGVPR